jgi:DNA-binding LacI/PurR family transcriptional regulator
MPKSVTETKYYQLSQKLCRLFKSMSPGDVVPTVTELKGRYNVSQATVDSALSRLRDEGLIYRPAGQMRLVVAEMPEAPVHRIVLIRPDYPSPTYEEIARHIVQEGKRKDWAFELSYYHKHESLMLERVMKQSDAAIFLPTAEPLPVTLRRALRRPRKPIVMVQEPPGDLEVNSVRLDDEQIGRLAVEHLWSLGHRRIMVFLSEPMSPSGHDRLLGWRRAMESAGATDLDSLIVNTELTPFQNSLRGSYEYFSRWLDRPHPNFTAIFCPAWTGAMATLRALRERDVEVPREVSVIAHGGEDHIGPYLSPPLTAVETDMSVYGKTVVDLLEEKFNRPSSKRVMHRLIPSALVVRKTTAPPAGE